MCRRRHHLRNISSYSSAENRPIKSETYATKLAGPTSHGSREQSMSCHLCEHDPDTLETKNEKL